MTVKMSDVFIIAAVKVKSYTKCAIPRTNSTFYFCSNLNRYDNYLFYILKNTLSYFVPQEEEFDKREIRKLDSHR